MCGITGITYFSKQTKIDPIVLKNMTNAIAHRGPDDEGFYINKNVGLGFRRLSIIDINTGHQPLSNEDQSIWIIFNGEIYNYKELQHNLLKQGHIFRTKSDTETIVHLYEQYGVECVKYLRGMFAFAIWDQNKQQLFCARDRFGIKPFYYYLDKAKFVFGSEIKAILKADTIDKTISVDAIDSYFTFGYITSDLSIFKHISKLQPGHYLLLSADDSKRIVIEKYWEIQFNPDHSKTEKQWVEEIEACFSETVKLHMISDVPLGAFLSGGIDSSSVVAMMARNSSLPIKTFSIGFKEEKYSELKFAREIAKKYGCEHHELLVEPESIDLLPRLIKAYDEPFGDSSAIPTYYVSKLAREFVTVVLSGDGGDELFIGYDDYKKFENLSRFPLSFKSPYYNKLLWGNINKLIPQSMGGKGLTYYLSQAREHSFAYRNIWTPYERKELLNKGLPQINFENASEKYKEKIFKSVQTNDLLTSMQYLDLKTFMVDDILTKVDRASMINSLEVRVPLLDHKFAELSFNIPSGLKLRKESQKYIFKQTMSSYLPESILRLPKKGFGVPISLWFKRGLKEYVEDTLLSPKPIYTDYLNQKYIRKIIKRSRLSNRDFSSKIWSLIVFNEWLKQNCD